MKNPASRAGNLVRFTIFTLLALITQWLLQLTYQEKSVNFIFALLFFCAAALTLLFYVRQFNAEKRYFTDSLHSFGHVLSHAFIFLFVLFIAIGAIILVVSWLQTQNQLPHFSQPARTIELKDVGFWLYLVMAGLIMPIIQQYLVNGFFFNYFFRNQTPVKITFGMLISAVLFAILQFQPLFFPAFIQFSLGCLITLGYIYTRNLAVPICLNIFSAVLLIILG